MFVHLTDINVSTEIDEYPSRSFQDIGKNLSVVDRHTDGHTDRQRKTVYTPHPHKKSLLGEGWGGGRYNKFKINP